MNTRIIDAIRHYVEIIIESGDNPETIKNLLEKVKSIYNLSMIYIVENDDFSRQSSFVIVCDDKDDWYERSTGLILNEEVYEKLKVIYDEDGFSEIPFLPGLEGEVIHHSMIDGGYNLGCIGMRAESGRVWTDEEKHGLKQLVHALLPFMAMRRYSVERKKHEIITCLGDSYDTIYHFDLISKKIIRVKSDIEGLTDVISDGIIGEQEQEYIKTLIKPEYVKGVLEFLDLDTIADRMTGKERLSLEFESGICGWCRAQLIRLNNERQIEDVLCVIQVIDEDKRLQIRENREKNLRFFGQCMEMVGAGIMVYTYPDKKLIYMNKENKRLLGIDESQSNNLENIENWTIDVDKEERQGLIDAQSKLKNVGDQVSYEISLKHKDGSLIRVIASTQLAEWIDGTKVILGTMVEVTEQYQLRKEITFEREQYRDAIVKNSVFSFLLDVTEGIVDIDSILKLTGTEQLNIIRSVLPRPYEEFYSAWFSRAQVDFLRGNILTRQHFIDMYEKGIFTDETEIYRKDNDSYYRVSVYITKREENGHVYAFINAIDITETRRKEIQAQKEIKQALEEANNANNAKTEFLSKMSHDIRTPMNAIVGMTCIAKAHLDEPNKVEECLDKIIYSNEHLLTLVNEILDMRKIEAGMMQYVDEPINAADMLESILVLISPQLKEKRHNLSIYNENVIHEDVIGDSLHLRQIFVNILSNAVKYTPDNGEISFSIREIPKDEETSIYQFKVKDNGIGMSEEYVKDLFKPFTREVDSRTNNVLGTGLGMSIVKSLLDEMKGSIEVESELGKGSSFTISIPLKIQYKGEVIDETIEGLSILVVDDEKYVCESACLVLEEIGVCGEWVLTGEEAVEKAVEARDRGSDYFAIIVDWKMPDMDGIQTAKAIRRKLGENIPIIVLTAYDWSEVEEEARAAGVNAFIQKPLFKKPMMKILKKLTHGEKIMDDSYLNNDNEKQYASKRALVVEDQEINMEIAHEFLDELGIQVEEAENGKIALEMIENSPDGYYDIVFMDVQMPVMGGYEATRNIRRLDKKKDKDIPIIAMTANVFAQDVEDAKNNGMSDHISKPIDVYKMAKMLEKWI